MRSAVGIVLIGIFAGIGGAMWWQQQRPAVPIKTNPKTASYRANRPPISKSGPWPEVVMDRTHKFESMAVSETRSHSYVVKNEGDADLVLGQGPKSCDCTLYEFESKLVKPGESTKVTVAWKPKGSSRHFRQQMRLYTNDPKQPEIVLEIIGPVAEMVRVMPKGEWDLGTITPGNPVEKRGVVWSGLLEQVELENLKTSAPALTAEVREIKETDKKDLRAKSGTELVLRMSSDHPAGAFRGTVSFKLKGTEREVEIPVKAYNTGSARVVPRSGTVWNKQFSRLDLGEFKSSKGKVASLQYFLSGEDRSFGEIKIKASPAFVECDLVQDPDYQNEANSLYILTVKVPPGSPVGAHRRSSQGTVTIKTDHPEYPEIKLKVSFVVL